MQLPSEGDDALGAGLPFLGVSHLARASLKVCERHISTMEN